MNTFGTLDQARAYAQSKQAPYVAQIEHATKGIVFVAIKCKAETMVKTLVRHPMPEIVRIIEGYNAQTDEQIAAERAEGLRNCTCDRCHTPVDGNTCYGQQEWVLFGGKPIRVMTYYCDECARYLQAVGDGEYTEMQERAAATLSAEPAHPAVTSRA